MSLGGEEVTRITATAEEGKIKMNKRKKKKKKKNAYESIRNNNNKGGGELAKLDWGLIIYIYIYKSEGGRRGEYFLVYVYVVSEFEDE